MHIFYASAESETHVRKSLVPAGARKLLVSYYYLRHLPHAKVIRILRLVRKNCDLLFLDSWAHTFLVQEWLKESSVKSKSHCDLSPHQYFKKYKEWLSKYRMFFDMIAELDIWWTKWVDYNTIKQRRDELCDMWLHNKLLVVWHHKYLTKFLWDWKDERMEMLKKYPYLAIWDEPEPEILDMYFDMRRKVWNYNRIHWFAETKPQKLLAYPYYSVDSTSRNIWSRYGQMLHYQPKDLKMKVYSVDRTDGTTMRESVAKYADIRQKLEPMTRTFKIQDVFDYTKGSSLRDIQNILAFKRLNEDLTVIWLLRWVDFENNPPKNLI